MASELATKPEHPHPAATLVKSINVEETKLKNVNTSEKVTLPSPDVIQAEKKEQEFRKSIEDAQHAQRRSVDTLEKNPLPTQEQIEKEKQEKQFLNEIEKSKRLSHVDTVEKNSLPTKQTIAEEKDSAN